MTIDATEPLTVLREERASLRERHEAGMGGLDHARALAAAVDRAITSLWLQVAGDARDMALVALGGHARAELSPSSDIDLMVLHDGSPKAASVSEALFYPLWDAGFTVGHATRTPKEALRIARDNLEAETSFLEPRLVQGDGKLFDAFAWGALAQTRKRSGRFVRDVREMMRARHLSGGSATSQLEPNIKEGAGGFRDLHVLRWFERVFEDVEILSGAERARLDEAAELLHRVRNHLHYMTERATDVLGFHHQRPTALFLGYEDGIRPAEDGLMRDLFDATRTVEHTVSAVVAELDARGAKRGRADHLDHFAVDAGRVIVVTEPDLHAEPEKAIELFTVGAPPGSAALRWLERALAAVDTLPWTEPVRRAFMRLLRNGDAHALEAADHAGVLGRLLPEWDAVRCQPQRNVYHLFTVDAHLFHAVAEVRALATGDDDPLTRDVLSDVADPDALLLAAFLHDAGKGTEEDHALRGARIAGEILDRMGLSSSRKETIVWLVRHHLLLVEAATRRDLNDENFVVEVATRIGDADRARMLYVLSVADGRATGPTAWSPWKAGLVAELFTKSLHVIERGELVTTASVELARRRATEVRNALTRYPADEVQAHLEGMPRAYMLAFLPEAQIRHYALFADQRTAGGVRTHVAPTIEPDVYEFTVIAPDRPGLFGKVSGVLALHGVNIVAAQGFTRADGIALEVFRCLGTFETVIPRARWDRIEEDIDKALRGRLSLELRIAEKRQAYAKRPPKGKGEKPKVIIDTAASDFLTVIEVHAPDRVGLLYDITSAFGELALDIQVAKVATYGEDVVDVFYVRDLDGQKIVDPEHLAEIERTLMHRLGA